MLNTSTFAALKDFTRNFLTISILLNFIPWSWSIGGTAWFFQIVQDSSYTVDHDKQKLKCEN